MAPHSQGQPVVEPGLRLLFQPAEKEVFLPPADDHIGDNLLSGSVILRL